MSEGDNLPASLAICQCYRLDQDSVNTIFKPTPEKKQCLLDARYESASLPGQMAHFPLTRRSLKSPVNQLSLVSATSMKNADSGI